MGSKGRGTRITSQERELSLPPGLPKLWTLCLEVPVVTSDMMEKLKIAEGETERWWKMSSWHTLSWAFEFSHTWNCLWTLLFWTNKLPPPHPRFESLLCHLRSGGFAAKAKLPDVGDLKLITVSAIWKLYKLFYHRDSSSKIGGFCTTCSSNVFQEWNMEKE